MSDIHKVSYAKLNSVCFALIFYKGEVWVSLKEIEHILEGCNLLTVNFFIFGTSESRYFKTVAMLRSDRAKYGVKNLDLQEYYRHPLNVDVVPFQFLSYLLGYLAYEAHFSKAKIILDELQRKRVFNHNSSEDIYNALCLTNLEDQRKRSNFSFNTLTATIDLLAGDRNEALDLKIMAIVQILEGMLDISEDDLLEKLPNLVVLLDDLKGFRYEGLICLEAVSDLTCEYLVQDQLPLVSAINLAIDDLNIPKNALSDFIDPEHIKLQKTIF